jgi:hypothetical protein
MAVKFYSGYKLLNMKDLDGNKPELYMVCGNRSAGKTFFFTKYLVDRFLKHNEKFGVIYRFDYELNNVADKIFKDVGSVCFPDYVMTSKNDKASGFTYLYLRKADADPDDKEADMPCGYALALNNADKLKRSSHLLSDTATLFFDEFQSETNHYCDNEISKFLSVHKSLARGNGQQVRYLPVIMASNTVSLINPYFTALHLGERLRSNTKFLRGHGVVLEQTFNESASQALQDSGISRAFNGEKYLDYASQMIYLNDKLAFIEQIPDGIKTSYFCTIKCENEYYAVRRGTDALLYITKTSDNTYPITISVSLTDHDRNTTMKNQYTPLIKAMRTYYNVGSVRFQNLACQNAFMMLVSY